MPVYVHRYAKESPDINVFLKKIYRMKFLEHYSSVQVTQSCLTLCDPMDRSTPGLPVRHQLPESTQTHVH